MKIYLPATFRWYISIHGWDKTTPGFGKRTTAISELCYWFWFWRMYSHQHVILHLPAKFHNNRTILGGVMTSYRFFNMAAIESKMYFRVQFSDGIWLRMWKSMCLPNFDEIPHSTAEIKLLPVSENGRPPFWNFISGFDFDVVVVVVYWQKCGQINGDTTRIAVNNKT